MTFLRRIPALHLHVWLLKAAMAFYALAEPVSATLNRCDAGVELGGLVEMQRPGSASMLGQHDRRVANPRNQLIGLETRAESQ